MMLFASVAVLFLAGLGMRYRLKLKQEQEKREAAYQLVLDSYGQIFNAGMTRKEVEDHLRAKSIEFRQMCCVDTKESSTRRSWDDLTKIGEEEVPWVCSENNVYVAFQFADHDEHGARWQADDLDTLKALTIYHQLEGCV